MNCSPWNHRCEKHGFLWNWDRLPTWFCPYPLTLSSSTSPYLLSLILGFISWQSLTYWSRISVPLKSSGECGLSGPHSGYIWLDPIIGADRLMYLFSTIIQCQSVYQHVNRRISAEKKFRFIAVQHFKVRWFFCEKTAPKINACVRHDEQVLRPGKMLQNWKRTQETVGNN